MSLSLTTLQNRFSAALHYDATGEECDVTSDVFSADERMQIYRNNFIIGLSEVLQAGYPMVLALVGDECFDQLARQHVLNNPLTSGDVSHYGEHFAQTLEHFPAVLEAAPYLKAVAEFEWQIDLAQQRHDSMSLQEASMQLALLHGLPAEKHPLVRLHLQPGVLPFAAKFAVFSLQRAIENHQFEGLDLNQAECGVVCHLASEDMVEEESWSLALIDEQFQLLQAIENGARLGEIPAEHLAQLNFLLEHRLLAGFSLMD